MKKIWTKLLSLVLSICVALPLAACGGTGSGSGGGNGNKLTVTLHLNRGGVQSSWFNAVEKRFEEATKDKPYGDKTGIDLVWGEDTTEDLNKMYTGGKNIIMAGSQNTIGQYISGERIMDITDVVTSPNPYDNGKTIESKLADNRNSFTKVNDQGELRYYGLPWKEYFMGITHNVTAFENNKWYFADETADAAWTGNLGYGDKEYYFIEENPDAGKSVGLDGESGTYDDGLPTTLEELMALCHKISEAGWYPFECTGGKHVDYSNYLTEVILVGLEGSERFMNYSDVDGEMVIVDGYTNENLWGLDDVYVPKTKTVQIKPNDKSTWNYIPKSVARYYAVAFIKYLVVHDMICECVSSDADNIEVQLNFIYGGTKVNEGRDKHNGAMLMEGSYWYTESQHNSNFALYDDYVGEERPEFGIMPYPAAVDGSVNDGSAELVLSYITSTANVYINGNLMKNAENNRYLIEACKEFIYFFYSDQEIGYYIEATGQNRCKTNYDWQSLIFAKDDDGNYLDGKDGRDRVIKDDCKLSNYQITLLELERDATLLNMEPTEANPNAVFAINNISGLMYNNGEVFYHMFTRKNPLTVEEAFNLTSQKVA